MSNRIYFTLLLISGVLFLILFSILSFHNRLAADDYYYSGCIPKQGIWLCMKDLYVNYSGRWSAYLFTGFIVSLHKNHFILFIFHLITITALIILLHNILRIILERLFNTIVPGNLIIAYVLILISTLYFTSSNKGETWFWLVSSCIYLWSIIGILVVIFIILKNKSNRLQFLLLFIASLFIGGASESYSLIYIFILSVVLILINTTSIFNYILKNRENTNLKLIFSLIILIISFSITIMAPGNEVRLSILPDPSFPERLIIPFKSFARLIIFKLIPVIPFLLIFCFPWIILGNYFSNYKEINLKFTIKPFICFFIFLFVCILPTSVVMSELGPDRALSIISFSVVFFISSFFYYIGFNLKIRENYLFFIRIISAPGILFIIGFQIFNQYNLTSAYAKAYDLRIGLLNEIKKTQVELVEIAPLPPSGMLYSAEISDDTTHFTNKFLASALNLNYKVKRADNP